MRERYYLNEDWFFSSAFDESITENNYYDEKLTKVRLPHTVSETSFNYFDESIYQMVSVYRRYLSIPAEWADKTLLLTFEGAAHKAEVFVNGKKIATHKNGYSAFTVNISKNVKFGTINTIVVKLDSRETLNQPPFGLVIDYMTYGGLYRGVYLDVVNQVHIEDIFIHTKKSGSKHNIISEIKINDADKTTYKESLKIKQKLFLAGEEKSLIRKFDPQCFKTVDKSEICIENTVLDVTEWDIDSPALYEIESSLFYGDKLLDSITIRFGFRTVAFKSDGFYLNGKKIKIRGLNRHQSYPYVGYAMPENAQAEDADILKTELALNAVRTSHYPQSQHFIDRCDEIGLLVFTEIPGWQHIGNETWQNIACKNTEEMVRQYRNHPSIILWGVRINESLDNDALYTKTNNIAHKLDPSRQTSGVRYLKHSNLLEDVYAFNDFSHIGLNAGSLSKKNVSSDNSKAFLISEYNGHMFPTKAMDTERITTEHAIRHANVVASYYEKSDIAGGFGWCMFDYNTHKDFGSGDRICYHGVLDAFRNPKPAASVYASQRDATNAKEVFAYLSSNMEIGEYPAGNIDDIYAFTNADSVKLYKNDDFVKEFFPLKGKYSAMPHPPIFIDDYVGCLMEKKEGFSHRKSEVLKKIFISIKRYGNSALPLKQKIKMAFIMFCYRISFNEGARLFSEYVANWGGVVNTYRYDFFWHGSVAKTINISPMKSTKLSVTTLRNKLIEGNTYDASLVRFRMENDNGRVLPFCNDIVSLESSNNLEIIGPKHVALRGGYGGTWVRTKKIQGNSEKAYLKITSGKHEKVINFKIIRE